MNVPPQAVGTGRSCVQCGMALLLVIVVILGLQISLDSRQQLQAIVGYQGNKGKWMLAMHAIWHTMNVPRNSFMLWLAVQRRLVTTDRLHAWIFPAVADVTCILCNSAPETHDHLFFVCSYSRQLMHLCTQWMALSAVPYWLQQWRHWLAHVTRRKLWKHGTWCVMFAALIYDIWEERNGRKHDAGECTVEQRFYRIKKEVLVRVHTTIGGSNTSGNKAFLHSLTQLSFWMFFCLVVLYLASVCEATM